MPRWVFLAIGVAVAAGAAVFLSIRRMEEPVPPTPIENVLRENAPRWMALDGVVGVGQGEKDGRPCILVMVARPVDDYAKLLPAQARGFPVVVVYTGRIRALGDE